MFTGQKRFSLALVVFLALSWTFHPSVASASQEEAPPDDPAAATRPRLSFIDGDVSFWRPGAEDWSPARVNIPVAPGDQLFTGSDANVEVQVGTHDYIRAGAETQLGFENQTRDTLQLKVTGGHVALDLRGLGQGQTVDVATPTASFTTKQAGYYRIDVGDESTIFIARDGGRATIHSEGGAETTIVSNDQLTVSGTATNPHFERYAAAAPDPWDQWNTQRSDSLAAPVSQRYVSQGVYGLDSLDQNGSWHVVPSYGWVWTPTSVAPGWAPYSTGNWMYDPYYGWSWLDTAPWGWAPYHYGRWVNTGGYWGWAPGPIVSYPYYNPALVAFYGGVGFGVGFGFGSPIGWVSLGWGEPFVPWWGGVGFWGRPCWWGWGGPHVVNNVTINKATIINANNINFHSNRAIDGGMVVARHNSFGNGTGQIQREWLSKSEMNQLKPTNGPASVHPDAHSVMPSVGIAQRPPQSMLNKPVVANRPPAGVGGTSQIASPRTGNMTRPPGAVASSSSPGLQQPSVPSTHGNAVGTTSVGASPAQHGNITRPPGAVASSSSPGLQQPSVPSTHGNSVGTASVGASPGQHSAPLYTIHGSQAATVSTQPGVQSSAQHSFGQTGQAPPPVPGAQCAGTQQTVGSRPMQQASLGAGQNHSWPPSLPQASSHSAWPQPPPPPRSGMTSGRSMQAPAPPSSFGGRSGPSSAPRSVGMTSHFTTAPARGGPSPSFGGFSGPSGGAPRMGSFASRGGTVGAMPRQSFGGGMHAGGFGGGGHAMGGGHR